jgi:hypothetical protein
MVADIIEYEQGTLDDAGTLRLFSQLIESGDVWSLQGHYGRTASALISDGWLTRSGEITDKAEDNGLI